MTDAPAPLIADFLQWLAREPRSYAEAMEAWRTSCPRLTVWEDTLERGLAARISENGVVRIMVTDRGRAFLAANRDPAASR